ncbi:anther-specific proline-rich protein APG-like [Penaeus japonicus]|uniref:anther-specific proline-rich protein APG-like n=1 Tax=Penaeus japonicus TaxID=27405 RepID=UPI001C70CDB9|nr:anther-specific proline-rich protein APG-like [Penaeus japonicus]
MKPPNNTPPTTTEVHHPLHSSDSYPRPTPRPSAHSHPGSDPAEPGSPPSLPSMALSPHPSRPFMLPSRPPTPPVAPQPSSAPFGMGSRQWSSPSPDAVYAASDKCSATGHCARDD